MEEFKNRVAIVTGASRGIGRAIVIELIRRGCRVAFNYHSAEEQARLFIEQIRDEGGYVEGYQVDVANFIAVNEMVQEVKKKFGSIDFLVNNAGITRDVNLLMMKEMDWDDVISTNLKGTFNATKAVIYTMMRQKHGRIVNISSITGLIGQKGQVNYAASKAGVIGFTKSLAKELAPLGMTANAIAAGFIDTDMTRKLSQKQRESAIGMIPMRRFGSTGEIAQITAFLLSEAAGYITGQVIPVDGGLTI